MTRSDVLTGKLDARDRATRRRRRSRTAASVDPHDVFEAWLAGSRYAGVAPGAVARIDLDAFVRDSGEVPLSPAERLRSLGVHLQRRRGPAPPPHALDRVF